MEEYRNSVKSSIKQKQVTDGKIGELHDTLQSYFWSCNRRRVESMFPLIEKTKAQVKEKQKQLKALNQQQLSEKQLYKLEQNKRSLIKYLKQLSKKVEMTKDEINALKINKQEISNQLQKNQMKCKQLQKVITMKEKNREDGTKSKRKTSNPMLPRISTLNFQLLQCENHYRYTEQGSHDKNQSCVEMADKDNFFTSITYKKLKQIQKILDEIGSDQIINILQKNLIQNKQNFNIKKVFKNYKIQEYFSQFLKNKQVFDILVNIQNS